MEEFKNCTIIESITSSLMNGRPLSRNWPIPNFVKNNANILKSVFGEKAFEIFEKMNNIDKNSAVKWYEMHGTMTAELFDAELWEDWNDQEMFKFNLDKLYKSNQDIYHNVAENIAKRAYGKCPSEIYDIIVKRFLIDPKALTDTIKKNVGKQ